MGMDIFLIAGAAFVILLIADVAVHITKDLPEEKVKDIRNQTRWWQYFIYYNFEDPRSIVPKRIGIGYTLNFARPWPKILVTAFIVYVILRWSSIL